MRKKSITFEALSKKLGKFISVDNATSRNGYGKSPNQFILRFAHGSLLQSYRTPVAAYLYTNGETLLYLNYNAHDCSQTTNRFVKDFCGLSKSERNRFIEDGTIPTFID